MRREENTLFHMFINTCQNYKDKKAFIYRVLEQEFSVNYGKLFDDVLVLSRAFRLKGIEKGSKVMLL
ncbi:MAG: long-chain fatty acid--CoA ligase, partial [Campylobacteraceae bacterium]|nr:long-chain fatty acid--CoA ligase [Campylobacteraceae bacterium]